MIKFVFKGLLRDKSRSLLPILVIMIGVFLTVGMTGYIRGFIEDFVDQNARLQTGHVNVVTKAYAQNESLMPIDLALLGIDTLMKKLETDFPGYTWSPRINFGGMLDVPDESGESKKQGPVVGMAVDLLSGNTDEINRLNLHTALAEGHIPEASGEVIIGEELARKLDLHPGDKVTFIGSTMEGSLTFRNFTVSGTIRYGVRQMDNVIMLLDLKDARSLLDMENGATQILGYSKQGVYFDEEAARTRDTFNKKYAGSGDQFTPVMRSLRDEPTLGYYMTYINSFSGLMIFILIVIMSIVLWNAGLLGGLRRYNEFGIRLAMGEEKKHVYKMLLYEALFTGIIGSVFGTLLGVVFTLFLQYKGIDISGMMQGGAMIMPNIIRAKFSPDLLSIGFIPGVAAMVIGTMLSGIAIFKRETAKLLKELEI